MYVMDKVGILWASVFFITGSPRLCALAVFPEYLDLQYPVSLLNPYASHGRISYIELPPLHVLPGFLVCDDHNKFRDLAPHHPLIQLRHDLFDVGLDLVIRSNWARQRMHGIRNGVLTN